MKHSKGWFSGRRIYYEFMVEMNYVLFNSLSVKNVKIILTADAVTEKWLVHKGLNFTNGFISLFFTYPTPPPCSFLPIRGWAA